MVLPTKPFSTDEGNNQFNLVILKVTLKVEYLAKC